MSGLSLLRFATLRCVWYKKYKNNNVWPMVPLTVCRLCTSLKSIQGKRKYSMLYRYQGFDILLILGNIWQVLNIFILMNVQLKRQIYYIYNKNISWETYIFFDLLIFKDNMIFHLYFPDEIGLIVWENVCTGECVCFDSLKLLMI